MKDIEQLKLILEAVGQTTESAKWVLLAWLGLDLLKIIVCWIGGVWLACAIGRFITGICVSTSFGGECRDMVVPDQAGTSISSSEKRRVIQAIQRGIVSATKENK